MFASGEKLNLSSPCDTLLYFHRVDTALKVLTTSESECEGTSEIKNARYVLHATELSSQDKIIKRNKPMHIRQHECVHCILALEQQIHESNRMV